MYRKVTEELPPPNVEVLTWNGEYEVTNKHDGDKWLYTHKFPITHWANKPKRPSLEEVLEVRRVLG